MKIPSQAISRLTDAGLLVSGPFPPGHNAFPDGIIIAKPTATIGNSPPGYIAPWFGHGDQGVGTPGIPLNAPLVRLFHIYGRWTVEVREYVPTPGPGDFQTHHTTIDDAIADILDFYFGDPARMNLKATCESA